MRKTLIPAIVILATVAANAAPPRQDPLAPNRCYDKVCVGMDFGPGMPATCTDWVLQWNGQCPAAVDIDILSQKPVQLPGHPPGHRILIK